MMGLFAFGGVYLLKIALNNTIPINSDAETILRTMPQLIFQTRFWLSMFCYVTALVVYLFLLHNYPTNKILTTSLGVNILLTNIGAFIFMGNSLNKPHLLGMIFIIMGIFFINQYE